MTDELHPDLDPAERRRRFLEGIERFNDRRFFDAHESWEEIWRSTRPEPRDLFQGLIQVAVGFYHHLVRHRPDVARRVLAKGRWRLERYAPRRRGLDLAALLAAVATWEAWLARPEGAPPAVPKIRVLEREEVR